MQLTPGGKRFIAITVVILVIINTLVSFYLYKTVMSQQRRIDSLERHDAVNQQVQELNNKYDSLKDRLKKLLP